MIFELWKLDNCMQVRTKKQISQFFPSDQFVYLQDGSGF